MKYSAFSPILREKGQLTWLFLLSIGELTSLKVSNKISVSGIYFILQSKISGRGNIKLKETHSHVARGISIPSSIINIVDHALLLHNK